MRITTSSVRFTTPSCPTFGNEGRAERTPARSGGRGDVSAPEAGHGNQRRFYGPLVELDPGEVALLNLTMPGGLELSTGVLVL